MPKQLTAWDQVFDKESTDEILSELAHLHLDEVLSKADREQYRAHIDRGDLHYLCNAGVDYERLSNFPLDAYHLRQVLAFYQKREDLDIGIDKREVAFATFSRFEDLCRQTNCIFRSWDRGGFQFRPRVEGILHAAQRKISQVLGDVPNLSDLKIRFGPGATTTVKRLDANARMKLSAGLQCSGELSGSLSSVIEQITGWVDLDFGRDYQIAPEGELVEVATATVNVEIHHGKLVFVPKTAKTDRPIAVEPVLNSMFQLGIGEYMVERLAAVGIDLSDQTRNQRLARYGSLTGELATLDLSSASDTVAKLLVQHLLPVDWYDFLCQFRTGVVDFDGESIQLQKFSSMGNGFTFPLETLIFWALTVSCCGDDEFFVSVYGDDIIVPTKHYGLLCEVLHAVGFVPNANKSFASGPFRESCGKDYLDGIDIRPCYIKGLLSGESLFTLHNFYVRTGQASFASHVLAYIHPVLRKYGPDGYGDGHLLGDWERVPHNVSCGWGGSIFETYTRKPKRRFNAHLPGDRVLPLYSIYASPPQAGRTEWGDADLRYSACWFSENEPSSDNRYIYDKRGRLGTTVPGSTGYKLVSIYTFS